VPDRQATLAPGIDSLEAILGLFKILTIRALAYLVSTMEAGLVDLVNLYLLVPKRGETIARVFPVWF
jgi:hypothetical protein